jgi:hypothetical protein
MPFILGYDTYICCLDAPLGPNLLAYRVSKYTPNPNACCNGVWL